MKTFIVIGWQCWGRGKSIKEAKTQCLREASKEARKDHFYAYMTEDDTVYVNGFGSVISNAELVRLGEV